MSNACMKEFTKTWWIEIYNRIIGAVVFLDDTSAESLHWDEGLLKLLEGGAVAVKSLSPFEAAAPNQRKAVFITETTMGDLDSIEVIIKNSHLTHCILISRTSLETVYMEINGDKDVSDIVLSGKIKTVAANELQNLIASWMDKKQVSVEAVHIPIFALSPAPNIFLTPAYNKMFPNFERKLIPNEETELDLYSLSKSDRTMVRRLASSLNSFLEAYSLKEDIYYMGYFSSILAGVLEHSPTFSARKKLCNNPMSLIILDRSLDLTTTTSHSSQVLLDKIMTVLPRFPGHSVDVAVDMSLICEAKMNSVVDDIQLSPGCLYHSDDEKAQHTFDHMLNKTSQEILIHLHDRLSKLESNKSPGLKNVSRVTPQSIEKIVAQCKGNYDMIEKNLGLLQQSIATVQTLKSKQLAQADLISSLEKQAFQNISTSRDSTSILNQISHLIKGRKQRDLRLERLLALLVYVYSLAGHEIHFNAEHEMNLIESLSQAILEDSKELFTDSNLECYCCSNEEEAMKIANNILNTLKEVGQTRKILNKYTTVMKQSESGQGHQCKSIFQQLIEDIFDVEKPDIVDLKHRNDGIKDLLRSGLSMLMSSASKSKSRAKKHPTDNQLVVIYIIGGATAEECSQLHKSIITSGTDAQVIIGSNKFVNPIEAMRDVLFGS